MSINKLIDKMTPLSKLLSALIVVAFIGGTIYSTMQTSLAAMKGSIAESKASVKTIKSQVNSIVTEQAVMKSIIKSDQERAKEFRRSTGKALDRILNKLNNK
jgi:hypothetical protein